MSDSGIDKAESYFNLENLYDIENVALTHFIDNALRANYIMILDIDYVVSEDQEILIVDQFTGRTMEGRRYSDGLHQAIEAKEGVPVQEETKTSASITYQNLFRMYKKLSGMTGTGKTEEEEFREIYNIRVIPIPTNRPIARIDHPDLLYPSLKSKFKAVVEDVKAAQALIANNQKDVLLEKIVADFQALNANLVVVKGVQPSAQAPFANSLNFAIAQTLDAQIILVANNEEGTLVEAVASEFGGVNNTDILGVFGCTSRQKLRLLDAQALAAAIAAPLAREARISPAAFRFKLTDLARKAGKNPSYYQKVMNLVLLKRQQSVLNVVSQNLYY